MDELRFTTARDPLDPRREVVVASVCIGCQAVQTAEAHGVSDALAALQERWVAAREAGADHTTCRARETELEAIAANANRRLALVNDELDRLRRGAA